jgi:hypothetical protein
MQVKGYRVDNFSYAVIDDYFEPDELLNVHSEIRDLRRLAVPSSYSSIGNHFENTGGGFFLDDVYQDRVSSPTLSATRKLFTPEVVYLLKKIDVCFNELVFCNNDRLLVNYYAPGQVYSAHTDSSRLTAVILLGVGDFSEGGFCFPEYNEKIEFRQNRLIIFPSCVSHSGIPPTGGSEALRISLVHFIDRIRQ